MKIYTSEKYSLEILRFLKKRIKNLFDTEVYVCGSHIVLKGESYPECPFFKMGFKFYDGKWEDFAFDGKIFIKVKEVSGNFLFSVEGTAISGKDHIVKTLHKAFSLERIKLNTMGFLETTLHGMISTSRILEILDSNGYEYINHGGCEIELSCGISIKFWIGNNQVTKINYYSL